MPKRGEAQDREHPWFKKIEASVIKAKREKKQETEAKLKGCLFCGDSACWYGECAGGDY